MQIAPNFDWWCRLIILKYLIKKFFLILMILFSVGKNANTSKNSDIIKKFWIFLLVISESLPVSSSQNLVQFAWIEINLSVFFDKTVIEILFLSYFFAVFCNVNISVLPISWGRIISNFWPSTFWNPLVITLLFS